MAAAGAPRDPASARSRRHPPRGPAAAARARWQTTCVPLQRQRRRAPAAIPAWLKDGCARVQVPMPEGTGTGTASCRLQPLCSSATHPPQHCRSSVDSWHRTMGLQTPLPTTTRLRGAALASRRCAARRVVAAAAVPLPLPARLVTISSTTSPAAASRPLRLPPKPLRMVEVQEAARRGGASSGSSASRSTSCESTPQGWTVTGGPRRRVAAAQATAAPLPRKLTGLPVRRRRARSSSRPPAGQLTPYSSSQGGPTVTHRCRPLLPAQLHFAGATPGSAS